MYYVPSITNFFTSIPLCSLLKTCVTHNVGFLTMISQGRSRRNHTVSFIQWGEKKCHHTETLKVWNLTIKWSYSNLPMAVKLLAPNSGSSHDKCSLCSFHLFGKILHKILYLGKHKRNKIVQETCYNLLTDWFFSTYAILSQE